MPRVVSVSVSGRYTQSISGLNSKCVMKDIFIGLVLFSCAT